MALEKIISQDRIEIVGDYKHIQVRTKTAVIEDGVKRGGKSLVAMARGTGKRDWHT